MNLVPMFTKGSRRLSAVETAVEADREARHVRLAKLTNGASPDDLAKKPSKKGKGSRY
jgi:hypothetical protein